MSRGSNIASKLAHKNLIERACAALCRRRVYYALKDCPNGATCADLANTLGWWPNRITGRLDELEKVGLIRRDGMQHSAATGHLGTLWKIAVAA